MVIKYLLILNDVTKQKTLTQRIGEDLSAKVFKYILPSRISADTHYLKRSKMNAIEIKNLSKMNNQNIIQLYDVFDDFLLL